MRLQQVLLASALTFISFVVAGDADRWATAAQKTRTNVILLNDQTFDELITTERNYTSVVVLTALAAQYQCALCREFDPEFITLAQSWRRAHPQSDNVFFAKLDFAEGRPIFMRFGIQSAPNVWVYPPTVGPLSTLSTNNQPIIYDFPGNGMGAEQLQKFLQSNIKLPEFSLVRPFNWQRLFITLCLLGTAILFTRFFWPQVHKFVSSRNTWAVVSLVTILMFTSGHMFNSIRHTPYTQPNGRGGFNYIAGGFQNQFGIETQIIANGLLAFTTMALALKAPTIRDPKSQTAVIFVWTSGILFIYSFLIYIFRIKNGGYPFRLFL